MERCQDSNTHLHSHDETLKDPSGPDGIPTFEKDIQETDSKTSNCQAMDRQNNLRCVLLVRLTPWIEASDIGCVELVGGG